jgi:hypothetical protein
MTNRPSVPEIITVNSEELQTQIRDLLPSQNGFGSELQASNVITPIIDLTAAAEGSGLPTNLQTALAFGSQTAFRVVNTTTTILTATGFFRIFGVFNSVPLGSGTGTNTAEINLNDGTDDKLIWESFSIAQQGTQIALQFDFIVFLPAGHSVKVTAAGSQQVVTGSTRQIATGDGTLIQPNGFPL